MAKLSFLIHLGQCTGTEEQWYYTVMVLYYNTSTDLGISIHARTLIETFT